MSTPFSFATLLKNSYHIGMAKTAALAGSSTQADYYPQWQGEDITNPSDQAYFFAVIAPGHTGVTSEIEYFFNVLWQDIGNVASEPDSYIWEIKPYGGAWATFLDVPSPSFTIANTSYHNGIYTTAAALPALLRLSVTAAAGTVAARIGGDYICSVNCFGTIS